MRTMTIFIIMKMAVGNINKWYTEIIVIMKMTLIELHTMEECKSEKSYQILRKKDFKLQVKIASRQRKREGG